MTRNEVAPTRAAAKRERHARPPSDIAKKPSVLAQTRPVGGPDIVTLGRLASSQQRTELLITAVGSAAKLADILGVSRSQPTRWRKGDESPSPQKARELVDLDHVMARAMMLFPQPVAMDWLTSTNAYLDGARPIDVLQLRGSTDVIDALDAAMSGAFA